MLAEPYRDAGSRRCSGAEARGFIFGGALAYALGAGFVPARKPGKLPVEHDERRIRARVRHGHARGAHGCGRPGDVVLIVDDVLATGGTAAAKASSSRASGATVAGFAFLLELDFLGGRAKLGDERDRLAHPRR